MAKLSKIIIFATFLIVLFCSLIYAGSMRKVTRGNFIFIYQEGDSLLVEYLLKETDEPLRRVESFFYESLTMPVTILIVKSDRAFRAYFRNQIPEWSQAIAIPRERMIVLKLSNAEQIRKGPQILVHEVVHILVYDHLKGAGIPTWLNEGLAEYFSEGDLSLQKKIILSDAIVRNQTIDLMAMDTLFRFNAVKARLAYIESQSAVAFLVQKYGLPRLKQFLDYLAQRKILNDAFKLTYHFDFLDFEIQWNEYIYKHYRYLVLLKFEEWIFAFIALLFLIAVFAVWLRNKKKLKNMEDEEDQADFFEYPGDADQVDSHNELE